MSYALQHTAALKIRGINGLKRKSTKTQPVLGQSLQYHCTQVEISAQTYIGPNFILGAVLNHQLIDS